MGIEKREELVLNHIFELQKKFAELSLRNNDQEVFTLKGPLAFAARFDNVSIEDEYEVEITIPQDYPAIPPVVKEVGGRIPKDFHCHHGGTLCLGAPLEVKRKFYEKCSLLGFVEDLLIPFLYSHSFKEKYGKMPYGELPHDTEGILQYYRELFDVDNDCAVLGFLSILADDNYRGHINCPCGSHNRLRNCHGIQLLELKDLQNQSDYQYECFSIFNFMAKKKQNIPAMLIHRLKLIQKKIKKYLK